MNGQLFPRSQSLLGRCCVLNNEKNVARNASREGGEKSVTFMLEL
jgi:hypothetical protein